jgi:glycosyltransferase involved in cell wall biosynthesis
VVAWNGASEKFRVFSDDETKMFRNENNLKPYFLFVGSIHPRKNVQRLVNSFALFMEQNSYPDFELVIVGKPMWKGHSIEIPEAVRNSVRFTGHLTQEKLVQYSASAIALTYVPYFEGFGIPLVEAMKCGIPILSGNKTSLPEIAGDAAIYCDPFNENDIAEGMNRLFQKQELRETLIKNGIQRAKLFSWDHTAEKVWEVIDSNH